MNQNKFYCLLVEENKGMSSTNILVANPASSNNQYKNLVF